MDCKRYESIRILWQRHWFSHFHLSHNLNGEHPISLNAWPRWCSALIPRMNRNMRAYSDTVRLAHKWKRNQSDERKKKISSRRSKTLKWYAHAITITIRRERKKTIEKEHCYTYSTSICTCSHRAAWTTSGRSGVRAHAHTHNDRCYMNGRESASRATIHHNGTICLDSEHTLYVVYSAVTALFLFLFAMALSLSLTRSLTPSALCRLCHSVCEYVFTFAVFCLISVSFFFFCFFFVYFTFRAAIIFNNFSTLILSTIFVSNPM